jgi:hypothetical protein
MKTSVRTARTYSVEFEEQEAQFLSALLKNIEFGSLYDEYENSYSSICDFRDVVLKALREAE